MVSRPVLGSNGAPGLASIEDAGGKSDRCSQASRPSWRCRTDVTSACGESQPLASCRDFLCLERSRSAAPITTAPRQVAARKLAVPSVVGNIKRTQQAAAMPTSISSANLSELRVRILDTVVPVVFSVLEAQSASWLLCGPDGMPARGSWRSCVSE